MHILVLSDALTPWHSVWIRVGQYIPDLPWAVDVCRDFVVDGDGRLRGLSEEKDVLNGCDLFIAHNGGLP